MSNLTADTDVFASDPEAGQRACIVFTGTRQDDLPGIYTEAHRAAIEAVLAELIAEGWILSQRRVFDGTAPKIPIALDTGFTHAHDIAGVFEAPDLDAAIAGTVRLERAGWARLFRTEWIIGLREFAPILGEGAHGDHGWAFLALWEWNDQWCEATPAERNEYDLECDIAFRGDLAHGVNISGRMRLDLGHHWHHLGYWEIAGPDVADSAIRGHEAVADFKFTTSRHIVGKLRPLAELIRPRHSEGT
ncbi:hypothetical protein [Sagittula stellata]|uniref:Uncharacterized protein n=1 Tax=Sagittula stellata (strain ATCC 700073 / DSM 11524 / E-37) TaxID=388399 RepID=A3K4E3_SAGS3|nr:hypothetical protein [Sagittula stellata]EBA07842.1 hypothetical protein SSE37_01275 [Sagittula stellata E-37]